VSYDRKHNEANGEGDRDGNDQNLSWNCGVEGPTTDPEIERLRGRQVRNFLAIEMLSLGVPMLLMGDEVRRTQGGNNNDYCHDDATAWFDWTGPDRHADVLRFTRGLIRLRRRLSDLMDVPEGTSLLDLLRGASTEWSGVRLGEPDLGESSRSIALTVRSPAGTLHLILNAYWEALDFDLPVADAATGGWRRIIDTGRPSPHDIALEYGGAAAIDTPTFHAEARSIALLASRRGTASTKRKSAR
jgi:glycogen operon protein